jgi:two-component system NtrC family sensor kinase
MKKAMEDLERSNQNLKDTQAQLVQSEKMAALGSLVAGIAHEINTPIGAVSSMHDTLFRTLERLKSIIESKFNKKYEQLPGLKSTFKIIDDSNKVVRSGTERVINIVRRLKSFARLDEAELKTVDIHEGLEDTLILIHHELKHNITMVKNFGDVPPLSCFPGQLNQIFLNLLINSKQAIKGKGKISITTFVKNNKAHIVIKDDGVGIPKEKLRKIFDPGFTTKGRGVGAGLGLSICYQIIQDHRGEIKVESVLGKSTTFTVVLPMDLKDILERENQN